MKKELQSMTSRAAFVTALACGLTLSTQVIAEEPEISEILGAYEIFSFTGINHERAMLSIVRTRKDMGQEDVYGLSFIQIETQSPADKGDGIICSEANLLPGAQALSCENIIRNPRGRPIFVETLLVGTTGSPFCEALKATIEEDSGASDADKIVDTTDPHCDDENEQCICFDITWRGNPPNPGFAPPSQGSGSGQIGTFGP